MITWVIGAGGLLGSAVARQCGPLFTPGRVPWGDPPQAAEALRSQARAFEAATEGGPWRVIWTAGAATTSTSATEALIELVPLEGLLSGLRSARPSGPGVFFLTSSAGGVYAGSPDAPPFTADSKAAPLSPYGELKLAQEAAAAEWLDGIVAVVIGRVSNLYGPGQNLDKLQGLISRLALAAVTQQPIEIFVPLGTIRDYLYSTDAARGILRLTDPQAASPGAAVHVLATGRGTTIGQLLRTTKDVVKRHVPVALGSHPSAGAQAFDLRLEPSVELPQITPLAAGIKSVYLDLLTRTQSRPLIARGTG